MPLELIETFPVGPLQCNCSIVADTQTRQALVIDPGENEEFILKLLEENKLTPVGLLHTHAHFDHIGISARLSRITKAPLMLHEDDQPLYANLEMQAAIFGLHVDAPGTAGRLLRHNDTIECGSGSLEVLHTPGHSPGSTSFVLRGERCHVFSGDTLFRRSIGRTDLWGGSFDTILSSIREQLFVLPGDATVIPGHGENTSIAEEARLNPFAGGRAVKLV